MTKKIEFTNITDELHFSSLMDELGYSMPFREDDLAAAFIAGQIALIQRMIKEKHGMYDGEKLIGVVDDKDLEQYLMEKIDEYKKTGNKDRPTTGNQQPIGSDSL